MTETEDERLQFNNLYINDSRVFISERKVLMCIKCEEDGYISYNCSNLELLRGEQSILKNIMLKGRECLLYKSAIALTVSVAPAQAAFQPVAPTTAGVHSVIYSLIILQLQPAVETAYSAEMFIEKGSGLNKQAHIEDVTDSLVPSAAF